jgi:50S ribosomal protein L4, bacterial/organelle
MEAKVYDIKGKVAGEVTLPENIFGLSWNSDLVHQVATSLMTNKRKTVAHVKERGEVRGGGKKPWQQKGTGRARHGSTRSPIWVGGGVTHGPRNEKNFDRKISKKMRAKALYTILSRKYKDGEILFVDSIVLSEPKTKIAVATLHKLSQVKGFENLLSKKNNSAVIALSTKNSDTERSMRNLGNFDVLEARNLHPLTLLNHKYLVLENPAASIAQLPGQGLFGERASSAENKVKKSATKRVAVKATKKPKAATAKKPAKKVVTKK